MPLRTMGNKQNDQLLEESSFGGINIVEETPIIQIISIYGFLDNVETFISGSGTVSSDDAGFVCSTGTTIGSFSVIRSARPSIYKPGQGIVGRISCIFDTPAVLSTQQAGLFSVQDGLMFGFDGLDFGVLHKFGGAVEIQLLTITTPASGSENATITIDGTGFTVPLTSGTVEHNAFEITASLNAQVLGFSFHQNESTIEGLAEIDADKTGAFLFSSATAVGSWSNIQEGQAATQNWTAQTDWDVQPFEGFDPLKNNVYKIDFQFLGYGNINYYVMNALTSRYDLVHTVRFLNTTIASVNLKNPSLNIGWVSASLGSTTDLVVKGGSAGIFVQGKSIISTNSRSTSNTKSISTVETNILTIRNRAEFNGVQSKAELIPVWLSVGNEGTFNATIRIIRDAVLGGEPNFIFKDKPESIAEIDIAGTTISGGEELGAIQVAPSSGMSINIFELINISLQPMETLTITGVFQMGAAQSIGISLTWKPNV